MNTNCNARFVFSIPKNIKRVNSPNMKYAAIAEEFGGCKGEFSEVPQILVCGNTSKRKRDHQKNHRS
jgi:hypothetical protein